MSRPSRVVVRRAGRLSSLRSASPRRGPGGRRGRSDRFGRGSSSPGTARAGPPLTSGRGGPPRRTRGSGLPRRSRGSPRSRRSSFSSRVRLRGGRRFRALPGHRVRFVRRRRLRRAAPAAGRIRDRSRRDAEPREDDVLQEHPDDEEAADEQEVGAHARAPAASAAFPAFSSTRLSSRLLCIAPQTTPQIAKTAGSAIR